ncbi:MAG: YdjY domain-containing protein [Deltaproteobacteria bacterium]
MTWKCRVASFAACVWVVAAVEVRSAWADDKPAEPAVAVNKEKKSVTVACKIAPRKLPNLTEVYPIEVIATLPAPEGKKAHETVVTFSAKPSEIHAALVGLGLKPGKPALGEDAAATGPEVKVSLEVPGPDGKPKVVPIEKTLVDRKTGKPMPALKWFFTGSVVKEAPGKTEKVYAADTTGTLIAIFPVTDETVIQTNLTMKEEPLLKLETNTKVLPAEGMPARLIIEVK